MNRIKSGSLSSIDSFSVSVEGSLIKGLPNFSIVGLAQISIQESKERVKSALNSISFTFPPKKIVINLSPSDIKKEGSHFDLPIALLISLHDKNIDFDKYHIFGELGLDGKLKDNNSIFPIILSLVKKGEIDRVIIPKASLKKVSKIPSLKIFAFENLIEVIEFFQNEEIEREKYIYPTKEINFKFLEIEGEKYYYQESFIEDFFDIKGQEVAKRASLISASGMHNILFEGTPGSGKSMSVKRLRYILPPMSIDEILEVARVQSLDGKEPTFLPIREFRTPHHTSSRASIFGGGNKLAKIGEVALANGGILFFDEFPHFPKTILESLREPLEDNRVLVSRVNYKISYETKFLFAGAMNPCPCGNLFSKTKPCRCNEVEIKRYRNRLSSPLLDRIEIFVKMDEVTSSDRSSISSKEMFEKVKIAFINQKKRGQKELNSKLSEKEIKEYCKLDNSSEEILEKSINRLSLTHRSINNILKVARTIADIDNSKMIKKEHLIEAISYRRRE